MNPSPREDSFAILVAETTTVGLVLAFAFFWPLLLAFCLGAALLWSATWAFSKSNARAATVLRNALVVALLPLPGLGLMIMGEAWPSSTLEVAFALSALGLVAWLFLSSVSHSNAARRRAQFGLSATWRLLALAPIPVLVLPAIFFLHPVVLFLGVFILLALRLGLGIATAIAWRPRSARKDDGVMTAGAVSAVAPMGTDRL